MCLNNSDFAFINKQLQEEYSIANYFKHFQSRLLNPRSLEKSLKSLMKFFISHFLLNVPIAKRIFERRTFKQFSRDRLNCSARRVKSGILLKISSNILEFLSIISEFGIKQLAANDEILISLNSTSEKNAARRIFVIQLLLQYHKANRKKSFEIVHYHSRVPCSFTFVIIILAKSSCR